MSLSHHGDNLRGDPELVKRFKDQQQGNANRRWPGARMGAADDGELAYAMAVDAKAGVILVDFGKPIIWIGLDVAAATQLRDALTDRILELRGITA